MTKKNELNNIKSAVWLYLSRSTFNKTCNIYVPDIIPMNHIKYIYFSTLLFIRFIYSKNFNKNDNNMYGYI